jgi:N-carbamoylputrescine amidase
MSRPDRLKVAVLQADLGAGGSANLERVEKLVRRAAALGAGVVVPPELFELPYFARTRDRAWLQRANPAEDSPALQLASRLAAELEIVIPASFFERDGDQVFNSVAVVDADGSVLGVHRKSHLPDGPGYEEDYYFAAGDDLPRAWHTRWCRLGVGVCWEQWFPECARAMALDGAELMVFPSAIGSEPGHPEINSRGAWQRVMQGHAAANSVPVAAANRCGREGELEFYGGSFVTSVSGEIIAGIAEGGNEVSVAEINLEQAREYREFFDLLGSRRPRLYGMLSASLGGDGEERG